MQAPVAGTPELKVIAIGSGAVADKGTVEQGGQALLPIRHAVRRRGCESSREDGPRTLCPAGGSSSDLEGDEEKTTREITASPHRSAGTGMSRSARQ